MADRDGDAMDMPKVSKTDILLAVMLAMLLACAAWGASFSQSCKGDACIGMVVPIGAWIIAFIVQMIALLADAYRRWRAKEAVALHAFGWFAASVSTGAVPLIFLL